MKLTAEKRDILGKKVKTLRWQGKLPGVVFGKELKESIPVTLDQREFEKIFTEAGESTLVDVEITNGDERHKMPQLHKVLISEVDTDPVSGKILHANLHAVSLKETITATVPIKVVGESPIVKAGEGLLLTVLNELEVEAFPQDLPSEIEVDVSNLTEIDQTVTIKDIKINSKKSTLKHEPNEVVLKAERAEMGEEKEAVEEVPIEEAVEVITKKKEEGEEEAKPQKEPAKKRS